MQTPYEVMQDPCKSNWLKDALRRAIQRDPVDAANDAEWLAEYTRARCNQILEASERAIRAGALAAILWSGVRPVYFPDIATAGQTHAPECVAYCGARS